MGQGTYGEVRECLHKLSNDERAVKIITAKSLDDKAKAVLRNEIEILKSLDHPNVVKMYEYFEDDNNVYIVTGRCELESCSAQLALIQIYVEVASCSMKSLSAL